MNWARKAARMLIPWTPRHERREAIASAAREKDEAQARAAHAAQIEQQILRMAEENHFAATIATQIMRGRQLDVTRTVDRPGVQDRPAR